MNVQQEGLGTCRIHGTAIMQAINQPGIKGLCFACVEDAKPKTGKTVVVKRETGDTTLSAGPIDGKVEVEEVDNVVDVTTAKAPAPLARHMVRRLDGISVSLSIEELFQADIVRTVLVKINEGIDEMPPPATIKEAKRIFGLQERIEELIKSMEPK